MTEFHKASQVGHKTVTTRSQNGHKGDMGVINVSAINEKGQKVGDLSRKEVLATLKISDKTLRRYCADLYQSCSKSEFDHIKGERLFSPSHVAAIRSVRELYKQGFGRKRVQLYLRKRGIPNFN